MTGSPRSRTACRVGERPELVHEPPARSQERVLVLLSMGLIGLVSIPLMAPSVAMDWRTQWFVAVVIGGAVAVGAFQVYGEKEPRGVPLESLVTPVLVAVAVYAAIPAAAWLGLHPALALAGALAAGAVLLRTAVDAELPFVRLGDLPLERDRRIVEGLLLGAAFLLFIGAAATLPGGWPLPELDVPGEVLAETAVTLALADASIALLVGFRLTAMGGPAPAIGWASGTYAVVVGAASILFRWLAVPGLMGPALLAVVLYLRTIVRARASAPDRSTRWPYEALMLVLAVVAVVAYQLLGR